MERKEHDAAQRRRSYDEAFKRDAVRLVSEEGYTLPRCQRTTGWARARVTSCAPPE